MRMQCKAIHPLISISLVLLIILSEGISQNLSSTQGDSSIDNQSEQVRIQREDSLQVGQNIQKESNKGHSSLRQTAQNQPNNENDESQEDNDNSYDEMKRYNDYGLVFSERCTENSQCNAKQVCNTQGHCQRQHILPLSFPEILGSLVIITILGFGQAAGVGGGTSITPILLALFLYDTKKSVAIVIVLVFSGSLGNIIQISRERTHEGVPVIDYRLILVTLPTLIIGTVYGVAINKFLPPIIVCILLVILLAQQIQKTYVRYLGMRDKEIKLEQINSILHESNQDLHLHHMQQGNSNHLSESKMTPLLDLTAADQLETKNSNNQQLQELVKEEYELYPKDTIKQILAVSIFVIVFSLLRGGSKFNSLLGIPACGLIYQGMNLIIAITFVLWIKYIIDHFHQIETKKEQLGYNFPHGKLSFSAMREYAKTGFLAGFLGGMLGIGGGIILIPRWLEYGISSTRTTACTLTIVCFTTFNSFFQLYLSGAYTVEEIVFFSLLALFSSLICRAVKSYVKKTKRDSILILILSAFIALATTLLSGIIIYHAIQNFEDSTKFGQFC